MGEGSSKDEVWFLVCYKFVCDCRLSAVQPCKIEITHKSKCLFLIKKVCYIEGSPLIQVTRLA